MLHIRVNGIHASERSMTKQCHSFPSYTVLPGVLVGISKEYHCLRQQLAVR